MADNFDISFDWLMDNEDRKRECAIVPDYPPGSQAISGINSHFHPAQFAALAALPQSQRLPAVKAAYKTDLWNQWLARITSVEVVKRTLDTEVNEGPATGVKILQESVNDLKEHTVLAVDGGWGPHTVEQVNGCDPYQLVTVFKATRTQRYRDIVANNPAEEQFLEGWLARAQK